MTEAIKDIIRWTWLGPLLISLVVMMSAAWAINVDRRTSKLEELVTKLATERGEINGMLGTIIEQNRSQDSRMSQISNRIDGLIELHIRQEGRSR